MIKTDEIKETKEKAIAKEQKPKESDKITDKEQYKKDMLDRISRIGFLKTVEPYQHIDSDIVGYTFIAGKQKSFVTSKKEFIEYDRVEEFGYTLRTTGCYESNLKGNVVTEFIRDNRNINVLELYNKIRQYLERFIIFEDKRNYDILTIWSIGTYIYRGFRYYPYISLNATKGSGKTRVMEVLSKICFNAKMSTSVTESTVFRTIEYTGATMLTDEFETLGYEVKQGLMLLLNSRI